MFSAIPNESWCCLSTDVATLPTVGVKNGQPILVMDTKAVLMFDETNKEWKTIKE
jgi:hypothetical protein